MASSAFLTETGASVETPVPTEGGFVGRFGLDPWLLLAQVVNFLILFAVLSRFVFRPMLKLLRARSGTIAQGMQDAEAATALKAAAREDKRRLLAAASAEAAQKLRATEEEANRVRAHVVRTAEEAAEAMHDRAARDAAQMKTEAMRSAVSEVGDLVVDTVENVLAAKLTGKERTEYREAALRTLRGRP